MDIFIPIQTYTIDSFPTFAASGVAALVVSRCLFGAFLPLAGPIMYEALGLGWGNTVLGFVPVVLIPYPTLIYKFGGRIRKEYPVRLLLCSFLCQITASNMIDYPSLGNDRQTSTGPKSAKQTSANVFSEL
ncbi:uncharacterized protein RAG0_13396 [Rhynchosporium agropyri]|uniref:Major facilitator superfamily (MFS) profile domain-containing protein n=1 Tax=Rhynchosporium agropyri TaxID=914238 RepID=A0A1E1LCH4_9HELO|nr:uncharacterized protein RAG0_13396 [Rhynchosporium agropyri]